MDTETNAGMFSIAIDGKPPFNFDYVKAWQTTQYIEVYGALEAWEQPVEKLTLRLADAIPAGSYNLNSPQVKLVDVSTGLVNTRYLAKSLTLNLTVANHATKGMEATYAIDADEIYPGGSGKGIKLTGKFSVHYVNTATSRR